MSSGPSFHTFVVHVEDKPGVLNRVASLFRRRAFNIESLSVSRTHEPGVSRMTIVVAADEHTAHRFSANLYKLVNVLRVDDITHVPSVDRNLALIKVLVGAARRAEVLQIAEVFRARAVDIAPDSLILEITGNQEKIDGLVGVLGPFGIAEMVQTGAISMTRGNDALVSNAPASSADIKAA